MRSVIQLVRSDFRRFGVGHTLHDVALRALNRLVIFKVLRILEVDSVPRPWATMPPGFSGRFLSRDELYLLANDAELDLGADFVADAASRHMECFGVFAGSQLASYSWYSSKATETSDGLTVVVPRGRIYLFKTFTRASYRGRRLFAAGIGGALAQYQARGYASLIAYVESNNFASRAAFARIGAKQIGAMRMIRWGRTLRLQPNLALSSAGISIHDTQVARLRGG